jgi:hypothetical protein
MTAGAISILFSTGKIYFSLAFKQRLRSTIGKVFDL